MRQDCKCNIRSAGAFEVFYDGLCPLCNREMDMVRRKDKQGRLQLTDIAATGFRPDAGKGVDELMKEIHGRYADGTYVTGVEVFREIYSRLGFGWLVAPTRLPILRHVLDLAYRLFAHLRYRHALRRMNRLGIDCQRCKVGNE